MATSLQDVYDCFLSKIEADDWMLEDGLSLEVKADWKMLLDAAIFQFRYPRVSLEYDADDETFIEDLSNDEIQVIASFMKLEWMRRCLATWDNIRQLYSDKDFSQANFLDKLNKSVIQVQKDCNTLVDKYGRAHHYSPNRIFGKLAGKNG